jgi:hypothetical protein
MMIRFRVGVVAAAGLSAAALALSPAIPAQAAPSPGWRIVFSHQYGAGSFSDFSAVAATSASNAWAFGGTDLSGVGSGSPAAEHWQGGSWKASKLPGGLASAINAASAPSASDVWAVSDEGGYILHFNGTSWSTASKRFTGFGELTGVTAFSPSNVWVFGGPGADPGFGTWHFNGKSWTKSPMATMDGIAFASALSPSSMWAIGAVSAGEDSVFRYTGSWHQVTASALSGLQFHAILARSAGNVWALANIATNAFRPYLAHLTGSWWSRIKIPYSVDPTDLSSDGSGGLWMTAVDSANAGWVIHRSASGHWSRVSLGKSARMFGLALIPGTASLWGAGSVDQSAGSRAAIWADGRTG